MPKEDIFERSGAQDLSREEMEKVSKPTEEGRESEEFREIEDEEVAPIVPMDPRKIPEWNKLHPDRQVELLDKYQAQKKIWDEWEKKQKEAA